MFETGEIAAVNLGSRSISIADVLRYQHQSGRLMPVLRQVAEQEVIRQYAFELEFAVSDEALQKFADDFRRKNGLHSVAKMKGWLAARQISVSDFETILLNQITRQFVFDSVTRNAAPYFEETHTNWDRMSLSLAFVQSKSLAAELQIQFLESDIGFGQLLEQHSNDNDRPRVMQMKDAFRSGLPQQLMVNLANSRSGDLIGPVPDSKGWALVFVEAVTPAVFDQETESAIRRHLFQQWLSVRIRESKISFPLLDCLSCSNAS